MKYTNLYYNNSNLNSYIKNNCKKNKLNHLQPKIHIQSQEQMYNQIHNQPQKESHNQLHKQTDIYENLRSLYGSEEDIIFKEPKNNINISTRGPIPKIQQIGILSKQNHTNDSGPGSDSEAHILPLLGRPTFNRSNKFVYYTATDKYNQVRIPISHNGRDCGGEYGCDEIMDGDTITIPELNGSFKAKIYENTKLHYIPY